MAFKSTGSRVAVLTQVRAIFVKHMIDLNDLHIRFSTNKLFIYGTLKRASGVKQKLNEPLVQSMFDEMGRIRDIRRIVVDLTNWFAAEGGRVPRMVQLDKKPEKKGQT